MEDIILNDEEYYIGTIDFDEFIDESTIKSPDIKRLGKTIVKIKGLESQIPHFHLVPIGKEEIAIQIYDNKYFIGKDHKGRLSNNEQCKQLNGWLKESSAVSIIPATNWQIIATIWNVANSNFIYKGPIVMPDYSTITG